MDTQARPLHTPATPPAAQRSSRQQQSAPAGARMQGCRPIANMEYNYYYNSNLRVHGQLTFRMLLWYGPDTNE